MAALLFSPLLSAASFCGTLTRKETDMIIRTLRELVGARLRASRPPPGRISWRKLRSGELGETR